MAPLSLLSSLSWWKLFARPAPREQDALPQCCGNCHQGRVPCPMPALCSGQERAQVRPAGSLPRD